MLTSTVTLLFLLAVPSLIFCVEGDYYWREFTGTVPQDAFSAGKNADGQNVYIGQAYIHDHGLMVVQITPGTTTVAAPIRGVKKITRHIKILCGPSDNFAWVPTNASNLHLTLLDKEGVIGGHEDGHGNINIGRISYHGGVQVGKINAFNVGNANFRYADVYDKEPLVLSYEVLTYEVVPPRN